MKRLKNTKIRSIIVLVILFALLICIVWAGLFVYKNRNSILAIYYTYTNQLNVLEQNKQNTDERALQAIKEFGIESVRPLTEEETEQLNSGEITEEEAVDLVLGKGENAEGTGNSNAEEGKETSSETTTNINPEKNEEIARLIGEMYVLKAKFSSDLKGIEDWVNSKYMELTKEYGEGNIPYSVKTKVGKTAYNNALNLEAECDAKVEVILTRLTALLKETGQSTNVVSEIRAAYENEKMLAKSYYMDQV
ncbi:MAG: hypothetical protein IKV86_07810 [Clostridia bacterium]|nr:hypothetical protein [Clostridia bacterium]